MKWASVIVEGSDLEVTSAAACAALIEELEGDAPDLVVAFPSALYVDDWGALTDAFAAACPGATLVGCTCGGVIGGGREVEGRPAVALVGACLPDVRIVPFHLGLSELATAAASPWSIRRSIEIPEEEEPCFVVLPDPFSADAERLVDALDATWPNAPKVGGLASGAATPGRGALFCQDAVHREGAVGFALTGDVQLDTVVAQGCRPIGAPMVVTRCQENFIIELDGIRAGEVLADVFSKLSPADQELFQTSLHLGLVIEETGRGRFARGDFLVRNILGIDAGAGVLAVGARLTEHQVVQFHLRDAHTSAEDLAAVLGEYQRQAPEAPVGGLLFSCMGRGENLYGEPDHDSRVAAEQLGPVPLGGFFCNGELGPVLGRTFLHGYTSAFGLFRPRGR